MELMKTAAENVVTLFQVGAQSRAPETYLGPDVYVQNMAKNAVAMAWACSKCGAAATGKFCPECGSSFDGGNLTRED